MHAEMLDHKRTRFQRNSRRVMERPTPRVDVDARATTRSMELVEG